MRERPLLPMAAQAAAGVVLPAHGRLSEVRPGGGQSPACHYFLELFLEKHGIKAGELTILYMNSDELLPALLSSQVDAIATSNKTVAQAQHELGDRVAVMGALGLCQNYTMILAMTALLDKRPTVMVKFLMAVAQAEDFIGQRPEDTAAIAQEYQKVSTAEITQLMGFYHYRLSLDHAMLMGLEDVTRWIFQQSGNPDHPIPNLMNLIHTESLRMVRPDAINLDK